jgi:hypothetical protein
MGALERIWIENGTAARIGAALTSAREQRAGRERDEDGTRSVGEPASVLHPPARTGQSAPASEVRGVRPTL